MPRIRFSRLDKPETSLEFEQTTFTIGRSEDCEFHLDDAYASRLQAKVSLTEAGFQMNNLGRNPIEVNGLSAERQVLKDGDRVRFGEAEYEISLPGGPVESEVANLAASKGLPKPLVDSVLPKLVVCGGPRDGQTFALKDKRQIVGRAADCDIHLIDQRISRTHLAVESRDDGYFAVLLSQTNTMEVNGEPVSESRLSHGDRIRIDPFTLRFESQRPQDTGVTDASPSRASVPESPADATRIAEHVTERRLGPRLVEEQTSGLPKVYTLVSPRVTIGRSEECTIQVDGDTVSRFHTEVLRRDDGLVVINLSKTNPILVNESRVREARLYHGDSLQVGEHLFTFISERAEDERPVEQKLVVKHKSLPRSIVLVVVLSMISMSGFLIHEFLVHPWQLDNRIEDARLILAKGDHDQAMKVLNRILDQNPPRIQENRTKELMADSVLARAQAFHGEGRLAATKSLLISYLKPHGASVAAEPLWKLLDEVRYALGQRLKADGDPKGAMSEYLSIRSDSPLYGQAQKAVSELWMDTQQVKVAPERDGRAVADLLRQADRYFRRKQYLTPADANAYAIYRTVLSLDPGNTIAITRISEMKSFYRDKAEGFCRANKPGRAKIYFQRYLLIDPNDRHVQMLAAKCDQHTRSSRAKTKTGTGQHLDQTDKTALRQERVKQLLEDSGVESNWMMDFLFEGKEESAVDAETPR